MKLLLVGPYPPPHGGISVHVRNAHEILRQSGVHCGVLNTGKGAITPARFTKELLRHAAGDWKLHVHTNGHNPKSWIIALCGGLAAHAGAGGVLTLHSGLLPGYLKEGPARILHTARLACHLYERVVCVSDEIAAAIERLGVPCRQLTVMPAFLPSPATDAAIPDWIERWTATRRPLMSTALSFRPEYGFDVLTAAMMRLRGQFPNIGCLVMGNGEHRAAAEAEIRERGLSDHVLLTGDVHHDLCQRLMGASDLFVRPTFKDGDANSVRESMALGVPVVASDVGRRPSGVVLFKPGDDAGLAEAIRLTVNHQRDGGQPPPAVNYSQRLMALYGAA